VLAVYIYRSGDEQVKQLLPGATKPAAEMQKEQAPAQMPQTEEKAAPAVSRKKSAVREDQKQDKQAIGGIAAGGATQKTEMPESKIETARETNVYRAKGLTESKDEAYPVLQARQNDVQSAKAQMADQEKKTDDRVLPGPAKKKESFEMTAPAAPRSMAPSAALSPQARVLVRVEDLNAAAMDVEKILAKYHAKKVTKQSVEGRIIVKAEVSGRDWQEVLTKLKELGWVEEKIMSADIGERGMNVLIELFIQ
jgi:hypothetical protein